MIRCKWELGKRINEDKDKLCKTRFTTRELGNKIGISHQNIATMMQFAEKFDNSKIYKEVNLINFIQYCLVW